MNPYIPKNDSDELNPIYMFHQTASDLLVAIVHIQIDPVELARKELKIRDWMKKGNGLGLGNNRIV